jgi:prepilin-type N-terminal cleavage/methylation domain-containing protein
MKVNLQRKQTGFTLIELMIASSLLMLVMYSGYFAYSLYSSSWQKQSQAFWQATDQGIHLTSLSRIFEGAMPYIVEDKLKQPSIYFIADKETISFVTHSPIFTQSAALIELKFIGNDLIYRESSLENSPLLEQGETRQWQHSIILLKSVLQGKFGFYGWKNMQQIRDYELQVYEQLSGNITISPSWYDDHVMESIRILPLSISLTYTDELQKTTSLTFIPPQSSQYALLRYIRDDS